MLNIASNDLKTLVLIKLMKSIIENSETYAMFKLEKMLSSGEIKNHLKGKKETERLKFEEIRLTKEGKKEQLKEKVKEKLNYTPSIMKSEDLHESFFVPTERNKDASKSNDKRKLKRRAPQKRLQIPSPMQTRAPHQGMRVPGDDLPEHLRYLKPTRTNIPKELKLGKLTPFLTDRNVKSIEIEGPDQVIYVKGTMGKKSTGITLTTEEVNQVLDTFSRIGKVPKIEGLFKVVTSNLILTAMVSESIGSRFIIKKM